MTVESTTTNGLKKSVLDSEYKTEYDQNLDLLDENIGYLSTLARINLLTNSNFGGCSNSAGMYSAVDGSVSAPGDANEIFSNATFTGDATGWALGTGWAYGANNVAGTAATGAVLQSKTLTKDAIYEIKIDVSGYVGGYIRFNAEGVSGSEVINANGTWSRRFIATGSAGANTGISVGSAFTGTIDNLTLHEVVPGKKTGGVPVFDGWRSDTLESYRHRLTDQTKGKGQYAAWIKNSSASERWLYGPYNYTEISHLKKYQGRTITFGCFVYTEAGNTAKIVIDDGTTVSYSDVAQTGSLVWIEKTITVPVGATALRYGISVTGAIGLNTYISRPMLILGSKIGTGNYSPGKNVIHFDKPVTLTNYNATSVSANAAINLESESNGKIPRGCKAVKARLTGNPGAVDTYLMLRAGSAGAEGPRVDAVVAAKNHTDTGWCPCDSDGNIYIERNGTFATTIVISAVEI
ncbi:MAG: hypothetical protein OEY64_08520 [Nitrospinota bacterium]|nr:hypothetical protein [Nitrospinota bacterium]